MTSEDLKEFRVSVASDLKDVKSALERLEQTVHKGDKDRGMISVVLRLSSLEDRVDGIEEKDKWRRAWIAGFGVSLGVIAALGSILVTQTIARLNRILEVLGGTP